MDNRIKTKMVIQALQLFEGGQSTKDIKIFLPILFPEHNKTNMEMVIEKSIEMYCSLNRAVDEVGGSGFNIDTLCEMKTIELISILGMNNVRFIYTQRNIETGYPNPNQKLEKIKNFARDELHDFREELKEHPDNSMAATAVDIYKEIIEKIENE